MTLDDYKNTKLPDEPGVYRFIDSAGELLYIGRATSLRDRVRSYFMNDLFDTRGPAFVDMVTRAVRIEWTETKSVLEAVILESILIKKFQPYYNIKEKDNKSYYYVVITDEDYPRVFLERGRVLQHDKPVSAAFPRSGTIATGIDGNDNYQRIFGPFPSGPAIRETLRLLQKIFHFRSGKTRNPHRDRFYETMGVIMPRTELIAQEAGENEPIVYIENSTMLKYNQMIDDLCQVLSGKQNELIAQLTARMQSLSDNQEYEMAAGVRNTIWSLQHIRDVTLIRTDKHERTVGVIRIEAYDIAHLGGSSMVGVMVVLENGEPQKSEYRKFHIRGITSSNDPAALTQVLARRFRHREWKFPNIIVMDGNEVQRGIGEMAVNACRVNATVVSVVKDARHQPRDILGDQTIIDGWREAILLANSESHRYALEFHKKTRNKKFLGGNS